MVCSRLDGSSVGDTTLNAAFLSDGVTDMVHSWEVQLVLEYCDQGSLRQLLNNKNSLKKPGSFYSRAVCHVHLVAGGHRLLLVACQAEYDREEVCWKLSVGLFGLILAQLLNCLLWWHAHFHVVLSCSSLAWLDPLTDLLTAASVQRAVCPVSLHCAAGHVVVSMCAVALIVCSFHPVLLLPTCTHCCKQTAAVTWN